MLEIVLLIGFYSMGTHGTGAEYGIGIRDRAHNGAHAVVLIITDLKYGRRTKPTCLYAYAPYAVEIRIANQSIESRMEYMERMQHMKDSK